MIITRLLKRDYYKYYLDRNKSAVYTYKCAET